MQVGVSMLPILSKLLFYYLPHACLSYLLDHLFYLFVIWLDAEGQAGHFVLFGLGQTDPWQTGGMAGRGGLENMVQVVVGLLLLPPTL